MTEKLFTGMLRIKSTNFCYGVSGGGGGHEIGTTCIIHFGLNHLTVNNECVLLDQHWEVGEGEDSNELFFLSFGLCHLDGS